MGSRTGKVQVQGSFGNILGGSVEDHRYSWKINRIDLKTRAETGAGLGGRFTCAAFVSVSNPWHLHA